MTEILQEGCGRAPASQKAKLPTTGPGHDRDRRTRSRSPSTDTRSRCRSARRSSRPRSSSASASPRSATTRTCAWPASAASAWSRSRGSGRCRRPAPIPITAPIKVKTHTRQVRQARRHILDLLLSNHYGECYTCARNNNCELQALAKEYGVDFFRFGHPTEPRYEVDRVELLRGPRHEQVRPLPPLRPHLHRPAGGRRAGGHRPRRPHQDPDLHGQAAGRRGLHQLRPVHQPLPDRRAAGQRPDRRGLGGHRRPDQARRHPDRPQPAGRHRRVLRPRARARR